jgi:D-alanyl-D-alanine carboxypeptidase
LTGTSLPGASPQIPPPHPQGYTLQRAKTPGHQINATGWSPSFSWTAGGIISTLDDMLTYTRALGTGQGLLSPAAQAMRLASVPPPAGYGLALVCQDGWVGHTGELPGFNTAAYYDTKADTTIVVMTNSDISSGKCNESPTLIDNPTNLPCASPARRVITAVSEALGRKYDPPPSQ